MRGCRRLAELLDGAEGLDEALSASINRMAAHYAGEPRVDVALFEAEPRAFVAALLGAWRAGKRVWLAVDRQPATLGALTAALETPPAGLDPVAHRLVLFTSGSTGAPQPVGKTFRELDAEIAALEQVFGAQIGDAAIQGTVSHQHIYGLLFRVLWPLAAGRAFAAPRIEFPGQWSTQAIEGDVLVTTPSMLAQWPATSACPRPRLIVSSGGALPDEVAERIGVQLGASVVEVFGSTETGGIAWREASRTSAWTPLPGVEWRIEEGRLAIRSPHRADADCWFCTADGVEAVAGGFTLLGRVDRVIKIGEKRVSLHGLESRLRDTGLVAEVRALMVPGLHRSLAVVLVPSEAGRAFWMDGGRRALAMALRHALLEQVEPAAVPRHWRVVEALPRNAQGKVTDAALAALFRPRAPMHVGQDDAPGQRVLTFEVPKDLLFFDGHFDVAPVVPGVVLVEWAVAQIESAFGCKPPLAAIEVLKFQNLVLPGTVLSLRIEQKPGARVVAFTYESASGVHASGRLRYADETTA